MHRQDYQTFTNEAPEKPYVSTFGVWRALMRAACRHSPGHAKAFLRNQRASRNRNFESAKTIERQCSGQRE